MKKKFIKPLCFFMAICILLNVNINVLASTRNGTFHNLNNTKVISTNFLTQEEIHDILEVNPADAFNPIPIIPYLIFTLNYNYKNIYDNHTATIENVSSTNKTAKNVVIARNVYYTTSTGEHKEKAVQREVGSLRPGQSAKEVFAGLAVYYHIDKIAYFAYTMQPTLSKTDTIWLYF